MVAGGGGGGGGGGGRIVSAAEAAAAEAARTAAASIEALLADDDDDDGEEDDGLPAPHPSSAAFAAVSGPGSGAAALLGVGGFDAGDAGPLPARRSPEAAGPGGWQPLATGAGWQPLAGGGPAGHSLEGLHGRGGSERRGAVRGHPSLLADSLDRVLDDAAAFGAQADFAVPPEFTCPITQALMVDPVVTCDGNTYERTAITAWLEQQCLAPLTGEALRTREVFPNTFARIQIAAYRERTRAAPLPVPVPRPVPVLQAAAVAAAAPPPNVGAPQGRGLMMPPGAAAPGRGGGSRGKGF